MTKQIEPIDTGQQFPEGAVTRDGTCTQCGEARPVTITWLRANVAPEVLLKRTCCAECVADFAAAAGDGPFCCETYIEARQPDGGARMQRVSSHEMTRA